MIEIKDLLFVLKNKFLSEELKKETIRSVISEIIKTEIILSSIEIKNNIIYLNIKSIYKNEIFIKKDLILEKLEKSLGKKAPKDIRWFNFQR